MYPDIIALAIPFMVFCFILELAYDSKVKGGHYRLNAAISNVSCGIFEQFTGFLSKGLFVLIYVWLYENHRVLTIEDTWYLWLPLMILVDFIFYFFHRLSHKSSFLWAGHMVHHEAEEYNLTVALRRSVMQEFTIIAVYLPLAIAGVSPGAFFLIFAAHNLYQFWIHTTYSPEMRWFGLVFNTPHHHEIHHSRNKEYIDKNFAGVFILWDKWFGTFAKHTVKPVIGIHQKTTTLSPVKGQVETLMNVFKETARRKGFKNKLNALFGSPAYLSELEASQIKNKESGSDATHKFNPKLNRSRLWTAISGFGILLVAVTYYRNVETSLEFSTQLIVLTIVSAGLFYLGSVLDSKARGLFSFSEDEDSDRHRDQDQSEPFNKNLEQNSGSMIKQDA